MHLHLVCQFPTYHPLHRQLSCQTWSASLYKYTPWLQKGTEPLIGQQGELIGCCWSVSLSALSWSFTGWGEEEGSERRGGAAAGGGSCRPSSVEAARVPDRLTGCLIGLTEIRLLQMLWFQHKMEVFSVPGDKNNPPCFRFRTIKKKSHKIHIWFIYLEMVNGFYTFALLQSALP